MSDLISSNESESELIDENEQSLVLRNEEIEGYNTMLEIGREHYIFGLVSTADLVIVENWNVSRRIVADDSGNARTFHSELMPFFNIESFPFVISKGN